MLKAANTGLYARLHPGRCQQCLSQQAEDNPSSLHSYLTMSSKCELLGDKCKDIYTFNYWIRDFFRNYVSGGSYERLQFQAPCIDACNYRRLFVTANQHVGLGPQAMRVNDVVAWVAGMPDNSYGGASGSNAACVLRKCQQPGPGTVEDAPSSIPSTASYHFIGNAYVHGLFAPHPGLAYCPVKLL